MGCFVPSEDVDDDDREFLAAAQEDATLVANLLIRLSRSETYFPRRQPMEPTSPPTSASTGAEDAPHLPEPPKWGKRRMRSRCLTMEGILAAKREEARRGSPTTPLSWSGGSWTSGSVCESNPRYPRPPRRRKQPDALASGPKAAEAAPLTPPAKRAKAEPYQDGGHRDEPAAVGSSSGSGSSKQAVAAAPPKPVAHLEPFRLRLTEGTNPVVARRPGKKKTVPELKALEGSLLQEQVELRKELEEQKEVYAALLEENIKLKSFQSSLALHTVGEPTVTLAVREEAEHEEPHKPQTVQGQSTAADSSASVPQRALLFDLNCPPDDDFF